MKILNINGSITIQDSSGRGTHISKLLEYGSTTLNEYGNSLRILPSGAEISIDFGDITEAKVVVLSSENKFMAILNGENLEGKFLMILSSQVVSLSIKEINGTQNLVRVVILG